MNNNWQFTNLENSKRMKELGFKQESMSYWISPVPQHGLTEWEIIDGQNTHAEYNYSAYSVAELGRMMPETVDFKDDYSPQFLNIHQDDSREVKGWLIRYGQGYEGEVHTEFAESEADARAFMLIWLAEQGHIDPKEANDL